MQKVNGYVVVLCLLASFISGCKTLEERPATVQLVTQYATLRYLERYEDGERQARAERIRSIATTVKGIATAESTLPLLQAAVNAELAKANLSPADRLLADGLVQIIVAELQARMGTGVLNPGQLVEVARVLDWVITATQMA